MTTVRAPNTKMTGKQVVVIQKSNVDYKAKLNVAPPPKIPGTDSNG